MTRFAPSFLLGAATAAHQVEGNNTYSDSWAQEQMPHGGYSMTFGLIATDRKTQERRPKESLYALGQMR